ncbi:hypothetical protein C8J57DRAFT_89059 [Mycena rebaudengoi]|nr:hypothetical protein C8J57DRAFT_89059 [Mycena rebaudengoi]
MFTSVVFTALLASSSALLSHAIVTPTEPGPGDSFKQGTQCHIAWNGDDSKTDAWKNMAIELMTGANKNMVHITTVATGQDGSIAGVFDYPCPEVTPNSAIYFYQFTAPGTTNVTWVTRFTIAGADGSSVPPLEKEVNDAGETILWGTGALVDPSKAIAAPVFGAAGGGGTGGGAAGGGAAGGGAAGGNSNSGGGSSTSGGSSTVSAPKSGSTTVSGGANTSSGAPTTKTSDTKTTQSGSAVGLVALDMRLWPFLVALSACASAFTLLL